MKAKGLLENDQCCYAAVFQANSIVVEYEIYTIGKALSDFYSTEIAESFEDALHIFANIVNKYELELI